LECQLGLELELEWGLESELESTNAPLSAKSAIFSPQTASIAGFCQYMVATPFQFHLKSVISPGSASI
jgi:hypothetical protein